MAIVVLETRLTASDIKKAREEYSSYIKITADLKQQLVAIGGEYHADAEQLLMKTHGSKQRDIWGGGYNITSHTFETNAMINLQPRRNKSLEIIDPAIRNTFITLVKRKLLRIKSLL